MAWTWTAPGATGFAIAIACLGLGVLVLRANPHRRENRVLASLLLVQGVFFGLGVGAGFSRDDPVGVYTAAFYAGALSPLLLAAQVALLALLPTPLARPLRVRGVVPAVWAAAVLVAAHRLVDKAAWIAGLQPAAFAPLETVPGPLASAFFLASALVYLYGLAATVDAFRRARAGTEARSRMRAYAAAFAVRDAALLVLLGLMLAPVAGRLVDLAFFAVGTGSTVVFVALLSYGLLHGQVLDIDLRVKASLRRGVVAAIFVAAFLVVTNVAANYFETWGVLAGGVAAGLLLFVLQPLQRFADRLADAAMPSVQTTSAYVGYRKVQVYRAALEGALEDGDVSPREGAMLARLRAELGLTDEDAAQVERDVRAQRA